MKRRGNCYVTCEALYHLMGGKAQGWKPMRMKWEGDMHWFLLNTWTQQIIDPTKNQFKRTPRTCEYFMHGIGCGFLTKKPSKPARALMDKMLWQ